MADTEKAAGAGPRTPGATLRENVAPGPAVTPPPKSERETKLAEERAKSFEEMHGPKIKVRLTKDAVVQTDEDGDPREAAAGDLVEVRKVRGEDMVRHEAATWPPADEQNKDAGKAPTASAGK